MTLVRMSRSHGRRAIGRLVALTLFAAAAPGFGHAAAGAADPQAAARDDGVWDLNFEKGNRRCRLFLRNEAHVAGFALAMPPSCHHAFPLLAAVTNWTAGEGDAHVTFHAEDGTTVLDFGPDGTAALVATTVGGDSYTLTPLNPATQEAIRQAGQAPPPPLAPVPSATASAADGVLVERAGGRSKAAPRNQAPTPDTLMLPPATVGEVAGNYAVLRQDRDTGCMVTLDAGDRGARTAQRARLAPACRDQGIVIFDPSSWKLVKNELVLTAKRGHSTVLTRRDQKTWANAPAIGVALVLKRL